MKVIGGYFELELNTGIHYHNDAVKLNTGRNALEYILRSKNYSKIFIPYYTCETILEPIKKVNLNYAFYKVDENLFPLINGMSEKSVILLTNYFGICDYQIKKAAEKFEDIIIDNSQSFFSNPLLNTDTFYSCRKFFGVPDGAYLYSQNKLNKPILKDISYERAEHLLRRIDTNADKGLSSFIKTENSLSNQPIKFMSNFTDSILRNINYNNVIKKRRENFNYLHSVFSDQNELKFNVEKNSVPMIYPLLIKKGNKLKSILGKNKIYVTTYWENVFSWANKKSWEYYLANNLIALPIDQRYNIDDMKKIVDVIKDSEF